MTIKEEIKRLDKKMEECINDPELPEKVREYEKKYGNISEENLRKIFRFRKLIKEKPKSCFECIYFGKDGEHLKSGKSHFPSLCEKDLLWIGCRGREGTKRR